MEITVLMLVLLAIGYGVAFTRKGKVSTATIGDRRHELFVPADANAVFDAISAIGSPFSIDDKDRDSKILVVSSPVTFGSWGFFYPVFLQAQPTARASSSAVTRRCSRSVRSSDTPTSGAATRSRSC